MQFAFHETKLKSSTIILIVTDRKLEAYATGNRSTIILIVTGRKLEA